MAVQLTNAQARRFILRRLGLLGGYAYRGKAGALQYIQSVGSLQLDPVDICGKSAEITLHSRVQGFKKPMLDTLLYKDRALFEYYDKQLCAIPVEHWPWLATRREERLRDVRNAEIRAAAGAAVRAQLREKGPLCPADMEGLDGHVDWPTWSNKGTKLANAACEAMYHTGELVIHHRKGVVRYYHLAETCLPGEIHTAPRPFASEDEFYAWVVKRRIGACGMLWNRGSDAWLGIPDFSAAKRERAFAALLASDANTSAQLVEVGVEGIKEPLYINAGDMPLLEQVLAGEKWRGRTELIAPLDSLLWDRRLVEAIFGFQYRWEIYTPAAQRKYTPYTLPVLHGERFVGRAAFARDEKANALRLTAYWPEKGVRSSKKRDAALQGCYTRFAKFNGFEKAVE